MTLSIKHPKEKMERKEKIVRGEEKRGEKEKRKGDGKEQRNSIVLR